MSGIEVAGLALAVFPILINGLNHVVAGIESVKRWKRYRFKLKDYADILESASVYFLDTLDELLSDIVDSDVELSILLANPGGSPWKEKAYDERLRRRLDRSYNSYLKTVSRLVQALQGMCERLGVDKAGSVKWDDYSILEREMKRVKLTFSKNVYKELLDDIRLANQDLRDFTRQNIALEPKKRQRKGRTAVSDLRNIRRHAASLHQVLSPARSSTPDQSISQDGRSQTPAFRILLAVAVNVAVIDHNTTGTSQWQDIEILPTLGSQSSRPSLDWSDTETQGAQVPTEAKSNYIEDFCSALCATDRQKREIGLLIDEVNERQEHKIFRANTTLGSQTFSRSLEDLLRSTEHSAGENLSRKDRLEVAVTLASSVLQLDGTSWLKSGWSSNDICFHYKDGEISHYSHPYLSWQQCCNIDVTYPMKSPRVVNNHMVRNEILLALGLTLVELCFGRTLTDLRRPEDINGEETATRVATATRLHFRVYDEMGISYGDVVRRCLFQLFDVRELSLDIEEVQQKVFDDVVTPLVDDLNNFNGTLRIR
ncbi:MAG: hypothetical protein LQ339_005608 [Xanthoria mediterranea]|nr:MAG: hypothetical protein LQ339_005608 [Xanthoria mediterranea]